MTSRRASRRKGHRPRPRRHHSHDDWAVLLSWCDGDSVNEAMRTSHDKLIGMMGDLRTGPVEWRISEDAEQAEQMLSAYLDGLDTITEDHSNYVRQVRGKLREFGGHVVVTTAPGRPVGAR